MRPARGTTLARKSDHAAIGEIPGDRGETWHTRQDVLERRAAEAVQFVPGQDLDDRRRVRLLLSRLGRRRDLHVHQLLDAQLDEGRRSGSRRLARVKRGGQTGEQQAADGDSTERLTGHDHPAKRTSSSLGCRELNGTSASRAREFGRRIRLSWLKR
jgi:hypothetical protein